MSGAGGATTLDAADDTNDSLADFDVVTPAPRNNAGQIGVPTTTMPGGTTSTTTEPPGTSTTTSITDASSSTSTTDTVPTTTSTTVVVASSTSTTAAAPSTTTTPTPTTALPSTSSTTTPSGPGGATSTTLACSAAGIGAAQCLLDGLPPAACAAVTLPRKVTKAMVASRALLDRASVAQGTKHGQRLLKKAAGKLGAAGRAVTKAGHKTLEPTCAAALADLLDEARNRALAPPAP